MTIAELYKKISLEITERYIETYKDSTYFYSIKEMAEKEGYDICLSTLFEKLVSCPGWYQQEVSQKNQLEDLKEKMKKAIRIRIREVRGDILKKEGYKKALKFCSDTIEKVIEKNASTY